jgi:glycosyltransferase involved in cell wall biosynthesis
MRIGIDGHVLGKNIGGVERYVEKVVELVPDLCLQHQFIIFVSQRMKARFVKDRRQNVQFVTLPVSDPIVQRSVMLPWLVRRHRLDVLHVQRVSPWACGRCRILLTVHDLIPIKYPDAYPGFRAALIRLLTPSSIARADFIVCPSQFVCDDIERYFPAATAPRRPFYNGVDPERFTVRALVPEPGTLKRHAVEQPYIFSPGAIEERKNIETIIEAIARLDVASRPLLLLSGSVRDGGYFIRLQKLARDLRVADWVRHLGFVSDDDLIDLYGHAVACVAASRDEGFNLLPLEALACGAPVLCSDIPVHRELYEDAVSFFPPDSPELLAQGIRRARAVNTDRRTIADAAKTIVDRLSWEAMAQRMATYLEELTDDKPGAARAGGRILRSQRAPATRSDVRPASEWSDSPTTRTD